MTRTFWAQMESDTSEKTMARARRVFLLVLFLIPFHSFAAKKDFKGIFGNYRRENFTENEAQSSQFGFDFMLSTLIPLSPIVKSLEDNSHNQSLSQNLYSATFFNYEASLFFSLNYNWVIFANFAHCDFETRRTNKESKQLFHQFEMEAIPGILGLKYRFSTSDIVPYVGIGAGLAYVRRKAFYDYDLPLFFQDYSTVLSGQVILGLEFYFSSRAGIRLETAATYFNVAAKTFDPTPTPAIHPIFYMQGNPWLVRYASGIFFLL